MNLDDLNERLQDCIEAQRKNFEIYMQDALKLHNKLNDFIKINGVTPKAEEKINDTLEIIEIFDSFDRKLTEKIEKLNTEINELTNNK